MGRHSTNRVVIDEALKLKTKDLKRFGYLKEFSVITGVMCWSSNFGNKSEINLSLNNYNNLLTLSYKSNGKAIRYDVQIIYITSNLGKGQIPLFICPATNKKCRNLYLVNGYFLHRTASKNVIYDSQTQSKYYRFLDKNFGKAFKVEAYYREIYSKHFKTHYKGKLTKRYKMLLNKINATL